MLVAVGGPVPGPIPRDAPVNSPSSCFMSANWSLLLRPALAYRRVSAADSPARELPPLRPPIQYKAW